MKTAYRNPDPRLRLLLWGILAATGWACLGVSSGTEVSPVSTNPPEEAGMPCHADIRMGSSTRAEVVAILGEPSRIVPEGSDEHLYFETANPNFNNAVVIRDGVAVFMVKFFLSGEKILWSDVKSANGEPEKTMFSNFSQNSMTYLYPAKGNVFIASEDEDLVFLQQCFIPMTLEKYLASWGSQLPAENPFIR